MLIQQLLLLQAAALPMGLRAARSGGGTRVSLSSAWAEITGTSEAGSAVSGGRGTHEPTHGSLAWGEQPLGRDWCPRVGLDHAPVQEHHLYIINSHQVGGGSGSPCLCNIINL